MQSRLYRLWLVKAANGDVDEAGQKSGSKANLSTASWAKSALGLC